MFSVFISFLALVLTQPLNIYVTNNTTAKAKFSLKTLTKNIRNTTFTEYGLRRQAFSRKSSLGEKNKPFHENRDEICSDDFTVLWQVSQKVASWASF